MKLTVLTHFPSPYQVELFNVVAQHCDLKVIYVADSSEHRQWRTRSAKFDAVTLDSDFSRAREQCTAADITVFNFYREPRVRTLIEQRAATKKPWAFWGERPGFRQLGFLGAAYRRFALRPLHDQPAPIWGIGRFAVDQYRREFGNHRVYENISYYSDLRRFAPPSPPRPGRGIRGEVSTPGISASQHFSFSAFPQKARTVLFSGALVPRKGIDLLASAFATVASQVPDVRLLVLGDGPLRAGLEQQLAAFRDRVSFLGFRDWDELPAIYAQADLLCVPSRYDGWGLVVPEGLAAGLPVISTDRTGAALEFVQFGYNGWLTRAGNLSDLSGALLSAATISDQQLESMSRAARESVADHSLERGAERFLTAARRALATWKQ